MDDIFNMDDFVPEPWQIGEAVCIEESNLDEITSDYYDILFSNSFAK
jgi:hypothetical protein